jgi:hypothetical protein
VITFEKVKNLSRAAMILRAERVPGLVALLLSSE